MVSCGPALSYKAPDTAAETSELVSEALYKAAIEDDTQAMAEAIHAGASPTALLQVGAALESPLAVAAAHGSLKAIELLLALDAVRMASVAPQLGLDPLVAAARGGQGGPSSARSRGRSGGGPLRKPILPLGFGA